MERVKVAAVQAAPVLDERDGNGSTLYNTLLCFAPDGTLAMRHRKLMPTGADILRLTVDATPHAPVLLRRDETKEPTIRHTETG